nr:MAG TPA: hypothetical protein [Caudoviricetes sp.]
MSTKIFGLMRIIVHKTIFLSKKTHFYFYIVRVLYRYD